MSATLAPSVVRFITPPRLPKVSPVLALNLRSTVGKLYAVLDLAGQLVDVIGDHMTTNDPEGELHARFPWFDHNAARRLGITTAYAVSVDVPASEARRWIHRGETLPADIAHPQNVEHFANVHKLRALSVKCARWMAVREALVTITRHGAQVAHREHVAELRGEPNNYAETDAHGATVYHRDDYLRRAVQAFVRAGIIERVDTPPTARELRNRARANGETITDAQAESRATFHRYSVGQYKPTPSTPDLY